MDINQWKIEEIQRENDENQTISKRSGGNWTLINYEKFPSNMMEGKIYILLFIYECHTLCLCCRSIE